jgi:(2R)-3-sulfolactate dehydrogenase (NADP+)
MSIHQSSSAGVLGWFVRRLAREGLVSLMFANSSKAVAAHGGKVPFFGTNPFAMGAPRAGDEPLVIDMATASTARVNLVRAAAEGREIEPGHAIDPDGNPTTDPAAGLKGAQLPVGGPKGFGLGLMVDVLAGVLTGSNCSYEASMFATTEGGPPNVGQTIIAMDPAFFSDGFIPHLETMFSALTEGNDVRIPGERRGAERIKHEAEGVEVPETLLDQIETLAAGG